MIGWEGGVGTPLVPPLCRGTWIPACAGMTDETTGMTGGTPSLSLGDGEGPGG